MNLTQQTYYHEKRRAVSSGILESAPSTFLLLIAVRFFETGPTAKSLIAASPSLRFLISPWVVSRVEASGWTISRSAGFLAAIVSFFFLINALIPYLPVFILCSVLLFHPSKKF